MKKYFVTFILVLFSFSVFSQWRLISPEALRDTTTEWSNGSSKWGNKLIFYYGSSLADNNGTITIEDTTKTGVFDWSFKWYYSKNGQNWTQDKNPNAVNNKVMTSLATGWWKIKGYNNLVANDSMIEHVYIYNVSAPKIFALKEEEKYRSNCDTLKLTCMARTSDSIIKVFDINSTVDSLVLENEIKYKWTYLGTTNELENSKNSPTLFLTGNEVVVFDTSFVVTVTDEFTGIISDTSELVKTIRVNPTFEIIDSNSIVFGMNYTKGEPSTYTLKNTSSPKRNWNSFNWVITNGKESVSIPKSQEDTENDINLENFKVTLKRAGTNVIKLIATSNKGGQGRYCVDTLNFKIVINDFKFEVPTAFTPDRNINKYFQVYRKGGVSSEPVGIISFNGLIFNRNGSVVYEWFNFREVEKGWNGKLNGDGPDLPAGTYFYKIKAIGTNASFKESGPLMLIRD